MKLLAFTKRNFKEIIRDPLNISFGLGFPLVILLLLTMIQKNIPEDLFKINNLIPGIAVFGLSFVSLFSAVLISKDRSSSLLLRLFSSPLKSRDYILGYTIPMLPLSILQSIICFIFAVILGLEVNINIFYAIIALIPVSLLFISIGLLCGTIFNDKQVGGVCGALLTNLSAWLSGTWFDLDLVGGTFKTIALLLPFAHAVNMVRGALLSNYSEILPNLLWVLGYTIVIFTIAIKLFKNKMNKGNV